MFGPPFSDLFFMFEPVSRAGFLTAAPTNFRPSVLDTTLQTAITNTAHAHVPIFARLASKIPHQPSSFRLGPRNYFHVILQSKFLMRSSGVVPFRRLRDRVERFPRDAVPRKHLVDGFGRRFITRE